MYWTCTGSRCHHDYYAIVQHRPLNVTGQGSQPGVELYGVAAAVLSRLKLGGLGDQGAGGSGKGEGYDSGRHSLQDQVISGQSLCHITQHVDATVQEMDTIAQCNTFVMCLCVVSEQSCLEAFKRFCTQASAPLCGSVQFKEHSRGEVSTHR